MPRSGHPTRSHQTPGSSSECAQKYSIEAKPFGRGSFATVHRGLNRETKEAVAFKVMTKSRLGERALAKLAAEISILRTLEHPNVVCLRDSYTTERRILIVLEFCGGGDLGQYIKTHGPSPESTAQHFMRQLAAGLAFLKSQQYIHRDIKPQNLLLSERTPRATLKIADFGLARHLPQGSLAESMLGSPLYMAPEILSNRTYDAKADLWSAGAVLYELVTSKHPFGGANQAELINNIRRNRLRLPPGITLSPPCIELLGMLLVPRPVERASLHKFLSCAFLNQNQSNSNSAAKVTPPAANADASVARSHRDHARALPGDRPHPPPYDTASSRPSAQPSADGAKRVESERCAAVREEQENIHTAAPPTPTVGFQDEDPRDTREVVPVAGEGGGSGAVDATRQNVDTGAGHNDNRAVAAAGWVNDWCWDWEPRVNAVGQQRGRVPGIIGIREEGPLPSLPALPFPLESPAERRSHVGGGNSDHVSVEPSPDFILDLAFAVTPAENHSRAAGAGSFSADDTSATVTPSPKAITPDWSRRKLQDSAADTDEATATATGTIGAGPNTPIVESRAALSSEGSLIPHSSVNSRTPQRNSGSGSVKSTNCTSPEPALYCSKGGSGPAPNASPAHRRQTLSQGGVPQSPSTRAPDDAPAIYPGLQTEQATPPSPRPYYISRNVVVGGDAEKVPGGVYNIGNVQLSPPRAYYPPPVSLGGQTLSGSSSSESGHTKAAASGTSASEPRGVDGVPMRTQQASLRAVGSESLHTIPEDSTGFVFVPRPSPIAPDDSSQCSYWICGGGSDGVGSSSGSCLPENPSRGPGTSKNVEQRQPGGGGGTGPSFLGLGNFWTTAVNTLRGVAGPNSKRNSWPRRGSHAARRDRQEQPESCQQPHQPHRCAPATIPSPSAVAGIVSPGASPTSVLSSEREHQSPHCVQQIRKMSRAVGVGVGAGSPTHGSSTRRRSNSLGSQCGDRGAGSSGRRGTATGTVSPSLQLYPEPSMTELVHRRDDAGRSPNVEARALYVRPLLHNPNQLQHHQRRHSDPLSKPVDRPSGRQSCVSELPKMPVALSTQGRSVEFDVIGAGLRRHPLSQAEAGELRRLQVASERAEVVGKRSILIVTLADRTAQEAMSLALDSPRDARIGESDTSTKNTSHPDSHAGRRHAMLTEALSLYVKALAILRSALAGVLGECQGASPSAVLLTQRSALATKASWLEGLFSQILQRAEHCRAQITEAATNIAAASTSASPGPCGGALLKDTRSSPLVSGSPCVPWATLGSAGISASMGGMPTSDIAAAAVYRSALENGQEAAVNYLLGRSSAAVTHYMRASALLQLLALEPEMVGARSGAFVSEESLRDEGAGRYMIRNGGWRAQLLLMADGFTRRVELIKGGVDVKEIAERAQGEGSSGISTTRHSGGATAPSGSSYPT